MINTPEYKLAKFLNGLIKPHIPDRFLLHSTEHFIDSLKDVPYSKKDNMVSFDVISLFTNNPDNMDTSGHRWLKTGAVGVGLI